MFVLLFFVGYAAVAASSPHAAGRFVDILAYAFG